MMMIVRPTSLDRERSQLSIGCRKHPPHLLSKHLNIRIYHHVGNLSTNFVCCWNNQTVRFLFSQLFSKILIIHFISSTKQWTRFDQNFLRCLIKSQQNLVFCIDATINATTCFYQWCQKCFNPFWKYENEIVKWCECLVHWTTGWKLKKQIV